MFMYLPSSIFDILPDDALRTIFASIENQPDGGQRDFLALDQCSRRVRRQVDRLYWQKVRRLTVLRQDQWVNDVDQQQQGTSSRTCDYRRTLSGVKGGGVGTRLNVQHLFDGYAVNNGCLLLAPTDSPVGDHHRERWLHTASKRNDNRSVFTMNYMINESRVSSANALAAVRFIVSRCANIEHVILRHMYSPLKIERNIEHDYFARRMLELVTRLPAIKALHLSGMFALGKQAQTLTTRHKDALRRLQIDYYGSRDHEHYCNAFSYPAGLRLSHLTITVSNWEDLPAHLATVSSIDELNINDQKSTHRPFGPTEMAIINAKQVRRLRLNVNSLELNPSFFPSGGVPSINELALFQLPCKSSDHSAHIDDVIGWLDPDRLLAVFPNLRILRLDVWSMRGGLMLPSGRTIYDAFADRLRAAFVDGMSHLSVVVPQGCYCAAIEPYVNSRARAPFQPLHIAAPPHSSSSNRGGIIGSGSIVQIYNYTIA